MIIARERIVQAYGRAIALDPDGDAERAIKAAAAALGIPAELVEQAIEEPEGQGA